MLRNLWTNDREATDWTVWPYDFLPVRKVSFHPSQLVCNENRDFAALGSWANEANINKYNYKLKLKLKKKEEKREQERKCNKTAI